MEIGKWREGGEGGGEGGEGELRGQVAMVRERERQTHSQGTYL